MKISKILSVALVIIMISTLAACDSFLPGSGTPPTPAAAPEATPGSAPEPAPAPEPDPGEEKQKEPKPSDDLPVTAGRPFPFAFNTVDIYGNTVTEASLGEKELFFVHYWATWCPPCLSEMPDLAQLERDFSDRVGFLVLLGDFDNKDGAIEIYREHDFPDIPNSITVCGETTFSAQHEIMQMLDIMYVPTTVIIDADGNMLEHLIGAMFTSYAKYLDMHLSNTDGSAASSGDPQITIDKSSYAVGENISITITGITQDMVDDDGWIAVFHAGAPHTSWDDLEIWTYLTNTGTMFLDLDWLTIPGDYELRLFRNEDEDDASFIMSVLFTLTG